MATKGGSWSDAEKLALLISIINQSPTPPNWKALPVPSGRTIGTCQKQYEKLLKTATGVTLTAGAAVTPKGQRGGGGGGFVGSPVGGKGVGMGKGKGKGKGKDGGEVEGTPSKKRGRGRPAKKEEGGEGGKDVEEDEEEESKAKKVKVEDAEEEVEEGLYA